MVAKVKVPLDDQFYSNPTYYRKLVEALQYLTISKPDIAFSINNICQFMHKPRTSDFMAIKRKLGHLSGMINFSLYYTPSPLRLTTLVDANWAGEPTDRKLVSGYCVYLGGNPIMWFPKKQPTVSRSSTEVEYRCLASSVAKLC